MLPPHRKTTWGYCLFLLLSRGSFLRDFGSQTVLANKKNIQWFLRNCKEHILCSFRVDFTYFYFNEVFLAKYILSEITFWKYRDQTENKQLYEKFSILSKWIFVLDVSCGFAVQTILILIPYNWYLLSFDLGQIK